MMVCDDGAKKKAFAPDAHVDKMGKVSRVDIEKRDWNENGTRLQTTAWLDIALMCKRVLLH